MSSLTTGTSLRTRETVATLTPAWRATSRIVGGRSAAATASSIGASVTRCQSSALDSGGGGMHGSACSTGLSVTLLKPVTARATVGPWRRGRMRGRFGLGAATIVSAALLVAACGGGGGGGGGSSSSSSSSGSSGGGVKVTGAKVIDPNSLNNPPKGTIHY